MGEYERLKAALEAELSYKSEEVDNARSKLFSRLVNRAVPVKFDDGQGGSFTINVRLASQKVRKLYGAMQMETLTAMEANDYDKLDNIEDVVSDLLATICVDEVFDKEFWSAGIGFDAEVPEKLLNASMGLSKVMREAAEYFRNHAGRKKPIAET